MLYDIRSILQKKYQPVLQLVRDYAARGFETWEEGSTLHIRVMVETAYERDALWEKILALGSDVPADFSAVIYVLNAPRQKNNSQGTDGAIRRVAHRYYPRTGTS